MRKFQLSLLILTAIHVAGFAGDRVYGDLNEFVATLPDAKLLDMHASGALNGSDAVFHAQLVQIGDRHIQQIFIFRTDAAGKLALIDQSKEMDGMGGSGNWSVRNVEFRNASLFLSFGYQWHGCTGESTGQFRFVDKRLVLIGNQSEESSNDKDLTVTSSTNLVTGAGYWLSEKKGVTRKHLDHSIRGTKPLSDYDGSGWISPYNTAKPVC